MSTLACGTFVSLLLFTSCGPRILDHAHMSIIGGIPAKSGEFAETVAILKNDRPICSGTVIAKRNVLTAAHCIEGIDASTLKIFWGEDANNDTARATNVSPVASARIHPDFWRGNLSSNDLALLTTADDLPMIPVSMMMSSILSSSFPKTQSLTIVGYGVTDNDLAASTHGIKNWAKSGVQGLEGDDLYVGNHISDTCQGDSGGSAFADTDSGPPCAGDTRSRTLVAVTSRGPTPCAQDFDPGIMTMVKAGSCWFSQTVDSQNQSWSQACQQFQRGMALVLSDETVKGAKALNLQNQSLRDIKALAKTQALESVDLSNNQIVDASVLLSLRTLKRVDLRNNRIEDATVFSTLKSRGVTVVGEYSQFSVFGQTEFLRLAKLGVDAGVENRMTVLALRGLLTSGDNERKSRDLAMRRFLGLSGRGVRSLTALAHLENLKVLLLSDNPLVDDVTTLLTLPSLKYVDLRHTKVGQNASQAATLQQLRDQGVVIQMDTAL